MILSIDFRSHTCVHEGCGAVFATTVEFDASRRDDHAWFYCPNGHQQRYLQESDAEKYKRRYESEYARCKALNSDLVGAEGTIRAYKGHATRHRKASA